MFTSINKCLIAVILFTLQVNGEQKIWHQLKDKEHQWEQRGTNQKCAETKAVHPKRVDGVLYLNEHESITNYILPADGTMVLLDDGEIIFKSDTECVNNTDYMYFNYNNNAKWFSSRSWTIENEEFNAAKPHLFSIPCECDEIIIRDTGFSINLELVDEIVFNKIQIEGKICDDEADLTEFLLTKIGQRMFSNSEAVQFVKGVCNPQRFCGCHNYHRFEKYQSLICEEDGKYCDEPMCIDAFTPAGHCCPICGAKLDFRVQDSCEFDVQKLHAKTLEKLKRFRNGKYENKIHFYASIIPGEREDVHNIAQLIVTEIDGFNGISVDFMNYLTTDDNFKDDNFERIKTVSGIPFNPRHASVWPFVFLALILVSIGYGIIYVHYIKMPKYDNWVPISRLNILRKSVAFARFDNKQTDDDIERINVGVKFDDKGKLIEQQTAVNDFDNPLFESGPTTSTNNGNETEIGMVETSMQKINDNEAINETATTTAITATTSTNGMDLIDVNLNEAES